MEQWKEIPLYPAYEASHLGAIRNKSSGYILRPFHVHYGYAQVRLYLNLGLFSFMNKYRNTKFEKCLRIMTYIYIR